MAPQVVVSAKSPPIVTPEIDAEAPPVLLIVTVCAALVAPTVVLP